MSGDVQPRKRKDKKKRKDEDDPVTRHVKEGPRAPHHLNTPGVHAAAMGTDGVNLHVQNDHGTGGHWCAKIIFFALLAILLGIVGLIILENRGISDLQTPVTESRFSEYFDGWVEENKDDHHDEHIVVDTGHDDHDDDDGDHGDDDSDDHNHHVRHHDDHSNEDEEQSDEDHHVSHENDVTSEEKNEDDDENGNEDEGISEEVQELNDEDHDDNSGDNQSGELDDEQKIKENKIEDDEESGNGADDNLTEEEEHIRPRRHVIVEVDSDEDKKDQSEDEGFSEENVSEEKSPQIVDVHVKEEVKAVSHEMKNDIGSEEKDDDESNEVFNDDSPFVELKEERFQQIDEVSGEFLTLQVDEMLNKIDELAKKLNVTNISENEKKSDKKIKREVQKSEDDDDDDDSFDDDKVFDNDSGEDLHLEKLSKQQQEQPVEETVEEPQSASIAVKLVVGLALVGVASQVFLKRSTASIDEEEILAKAKIEQQKHADNQTQAFEDLAMRRRLTIADNEIDYDNDDGLEVEMDDYEDEYDGDEGDEIEYDDDDYDEDEDEENLIDEIPKSFEQFSTLYKQQPEPIPINVKDEPKKPSTTLFYDSPKQSAFTVKEPIIQTSLKREIKEPMINPVVSPKQQPPKVEPAKMIVKDPVPQSKPTPIQPSVGPVPQTTPIPPIQLSVVPQPTSTGAISKVITTKETLPMASIPTKVTIPHDSGADNVDDDDIEYDYDEDEEYEDEDERYSGEDEEVDDEEEISDVDDSDLLKRLDAKYGKLPDVDKDDEHDGDDSWTKVPPRGGAQAFDEVDEELAKAHNLLNSSPKLALEIFERILKKRSFHPGAMYGKALALDILSEKYQSNSMLDEAIEAFEKVVKLRSRINDTLLKLAGERCIELMRFKGQQMKAVHIHQLLMDRFPDDPHYRNQLAVTYLLVNRLAEAKDVLHETLVRWRYNGFALVHYGFVLKNLDKHLEHAAMYLQEGIDTGEEGTSDGRFYFHLGDALTKLGRKDEAMKVYREGAKKNLFPSEYQRSLYNVDRLKSHPFWTKEQTTYEKHFDVLESNWEKIRDEGLSILNEAGYFKDEFEDLKDIGDWKQFDLIVRGQKITKNCLKAPFTCKILETFPAARNCRRGQIKFSVMHPNTHVWPHCGPTNCRIRAHLGLKVPPGTSIRVAEEINTWEEGKMLIFDDSFEHEVWHNGTSLRLVLIVDVWHPDLTPHEWNSLAAI